MAFDPTSEQGKAITARLEREGIIWHVSVSGEGEPRPMPVWFLWDGSSITIYSKRDTKVRNIASNPRVAMHLNSDEHGGNIVILYGTMVEDATVLDGHENTPYLTKYKEGLKEFVPEGGDVKTFFNDYSVKLRFTIDDVNAW